MPDTILRILESVPEQLNGDKASEDLFLGDLLRRVDQIGVSDMFLNSNINGLYKNSKISVHLHFCRCSEESFRGFLALWRRIKGRRRY
jgi:hypothetical protein